MIETITQNDVKFSASITFRGKIARPGNVFFIYSIKYGKITFAKAAEVCRSGMSEKDEKLSKAKLKFDFLEQLKSEIR